MDAFRFELLKTDDSGDVQKPEGYGAASEHLKDVLRAAHFGHAYNAPKGSHGTAISPRGHADLAILLGLEHPSYRPRNLAEGATQLYDSKGNVVFCNLGNGITISTKTGDVVVTSAGKIYLGGAAGAYPVVTTAGPSSIVYAKL